MLFCQNKLYIVSSSIDPYMLHIPIGLPCCKLQNKVEMTVMLALVRQILLWIEEFQTFNMVSRIDLRHLAL